MEFGESIGQAVIRETKEETGLDVKPTGLIGIYSDPGHVIAYADGEVRQEFSICFRAAVVGGQASVADEESKEVLFVSPGALESLAMHRSTRLRIQHFLEGRSSPYFT
jgi:ADP-ribose pyrophosphatase YjhB (NUDIX family)